MHAIDPKARRWLFASGISAFILAGSYAILGWPMFVSLGLAAGSCFLLMP